jgi:hypothetical protein
MICHSFEFEPLGRHEAHKKYEPRRSRIQRNAIDDVVWGELSPALQIESINSYIDFIEGLPERPSISVDQIINDDNDLREMLIEEANGLRNWWTRFAPR